MLGASALFAWPVNTRRARIGWIVLLALAVAYGVALNVQPVNFPGSNFVHYYLGAKYPAPYLETYRLIQAGLARPQVGMRDLERPERLVRESVSEQRAYFIDLLRAARVPFEPLSRLDSLAALARESGAIEQEARRIMASRLPASRIADFRRDVRAAIPAGPGHYLRDPTLDYGYNGSPFYGLLRQVDPMLHLPFDRWAAVAGLAWQLLGVAAVACLAGPALGLSTAERVAVAALIAASAEFASFAMPGLVFTELWVPVLLAAWALRRGKSPPAGLAIAVAGLLKLFPFGMTLVAAVPLARTFRRGTSAEAAAVVRKRAIALLATCAAAALGLGWLSLAGGRTWTDFFHKIAIEFQSESSMMNSVSAAAALAAIGAPRDSPLPALIALASLVALLAMFWPRRGGGLDDALARRSLVLVAAMGWLVKSWLHYYAIVPFVLLPLLARRSRVSAAVMAAGMTAAYLLPGFDDPALFQNPALHALKIVPYLAVPAWFVWLELRQDGWGRGAARVAAAAGVLLVLAAGEEIWRGGELRRLADQGEAALADSDPSRALESYDRLLRLCPRDAGAERQRAIALAEQGRLPEAIAGFARAAALAPRDAAAHDDYGRALLLSGRAPEAAAQLLEASALAPADVQVLVQLARARFEQGKRDEAIATLTRARELAPEDTGISEALDRLRGR